MVARIYSTHALLVRTGPYLQRPISQSPRCLSPSLADPVRSHTCTHTHLLRDISQVQYCQLKTVTVYTSTLALGCHSARARAARQDTVQWLLTTLRHLTSAGFRTTPGHDARQTGVCWRLLAFCAVPIAARRAGEPHRSLLLLWTWPALSATAIRNREGPF